MQATLELGKDALSFGFGGTGKKSHNNTFDDFGEPFDKGDTIGCAIDLVDDTISFFKNGKSLGAAFSGPSRIVQGASLHPAVCIKNSTVRLQFRNPQFLPPGFRPVDDAGGLEQDEISAEFQRQLRQRASGAVNGPTCIVLEPTLELAEQVVAETAKFAKYLANPQLKLVKIIGKRDTRDILSDLRRGADIVVGTPGKIEQFLKSGELVLSRAKFLVLDEADRFASENLSFVVQLYTKMQESNGGHTQVCMFSATLHSREITELAESIAPRASWVDLKGKEHVPETVHHAVVYVDPKETKWTSAEYVTDGVHKGEKLAGDTYLSEGVKSMKPQALLKIIDAYKMDQCLIFCRTRLDCDLLSAFLSQKGGKKQVVGKETGKENPYTNVTLHSGLSASQRSENLDFFKQGFARFLICTDVAARGIDIAALPYVINMTLPDKTEDYIHRVGRTGRSDRMGLAISIIARSKEKVWYHTCPNRGDGCFNTTVAHAVPNTNPPRYDGGCCIWYNEPELALAIERRLRSPFDELDPVTLRYHTVGDVVYGRSKEEQQRLQSTVDLSAVARFVALEKETQASFLVTQKRLAEVLASK